MFVLIRFIGNIGQHQIWYCTFKFRFFNHVKNNIFRKPNAQSSYSNKVSTTPRSFNPTVQSSNIIDAGFGAITSSLYIDTLQKEHGLPSTTRVVPSHHVIKYTKIISESSRKQLLHAKPWFTHLDTMVEKQYKAYSKQRH